MTDDTAYGSCDCAPLRSGRVENMVRGLSNAMDHARDAERTAEIGGFLQQFDPRSKLVMLLALIIATTLSVSLTALCALAVVAILLALASGISIGRLSRQVWIGVLLFTGIIALPALFLVPGDVVARLPLLDWTVSLQGLRSAAFLIGRAEICATLALLLILSTPWPHVLKALSSLGVPVVVVAILGMTHRYIFILLQSATQMFEARLSRVVGPLPNAERRRLVISTAGVLLAKSIAHATDVHMAMISRGYRGEVHLLDDFVMRRRDWLAIAIGLCIPAVIFWWQH
jgi:cobalt/nickel transport system permease protein